MSENRQSLILITVDCLRADHCGFYGYSRPGASRRGYSRPTTPCLDSLAAQSLVVPTAIVAGAPTYFSLPAVLASRMPLALGRDVIGLAPGEEALAEVLNHAGYATAAFSAANPYISARFGFGQGFDEFRDFLDFDRGANAKAEFVEEFNHANKRGPHPLNRWLKKASHAVGLGELYDELYFQYRVRIAASPVASVDELRKYPSADVIVEAAKSWLATVNSQKPFFLWLHLMDPHAPYYPPAAAFEELTGKKLSPDRARYVNEFWNRSDLSADGLRGKKEEIIDLYDASIRWADAQIGRLIEYLKTANRWDNCVFALTADHGEEFLEHGRRFHVPVSISEEIVHVPLLIRRPGAAIQPETAATTDPFSLLHLAPTLLDMLGVPSSPSFRGKSLWRQMRREPPADHQPEPALTEMAYDCTNPFRFRSRLSPRLLAVRDRRYKLVIRLESDGVEQVYDLQADPVAQSPLPPREALHIRKRFLKIAADHISSSIADRSVAPRLRGRLCDLKLEFASRPSDEDCAG